MAEKKDSPSYMCTMRVMSACLPAGDFDDEGRKRIDLNSVPFDRSGPAELFDSHVSFPSANELGHDHRGGMKNPLSPLTFPE